MRTFIVLALAGFAAAQAPPTITSVVNAGSNDARFCSGLLVTITGNNFGNVQGSVTVAGGGQATVTTSWISNVAVGVYQVTFTPAADLPLGTPLDVIVSIGEKSTAKRTLVINAPTGAPIVSTLVNAGNSHAGFSPGVLVA